MQYLCNYDNIFRLISHSSDGKEIIMKKILTIIVSIFLTLAMCITAFAYKEDIDDTNMKGTDYVEIGTIDTFSSNETRPFIINTLTGQILYYSLDSKKISRIAVYGNGGETIEAITTIAIPIESRAGDYIENSVTDVTYSVKQVLRLNYITGSYKGNPAYKPVSATVNYTILDPNVTFAGGNIGIVGVGTVAEEGYNGETLVKKHFTTLTASVNASTNAPFVSVSDILGSCSAGTNATLQHGTGSPWVFGNTVVATGAQIDPSNFAVVTRPR